MLWGPRKGEFIFARSIFPSGFPLSLAVGRIRTKQRYVSAPLSPGLGASLPVSVNETKLDEQMFVFWCLMENRRSGSLTAWWQGRLE
ncbi:hypothetical protein SBV1_1800004 [Verrucomicrobia bacterium]|nr:hypothetical protein SBV1_1800004 [Verrucomicrobiota bacterium]